MPRGDHWADWQSRLQAGAVVTPEGCLEWQRSRNSRGYGVIYFDGKLHLAHRAAFLARHGRWPEEGMVVDHACENKGCVNPEHLREMSNSENILRAYRHLDPAGEALRARNREACARYRAKQKRGGEKNSLV